MSATGQSPWAKEEHPPCPNHGLSYFDESGRCLPSCGFGWLFDPLSIVRDEYYLTGEADR